MPSFLHTPPSKTARIWGGVVLCLALTNCTSLLPTTGQEETRTYLLEANITKGVSTTTKAGPTLVVAMPDASPGLDSTGIAYVREPHRLDYYLKSQWADTPRRMIRPLLVTALEATGQFRAVLAAPSPLSGDMLLETEILRLQQEFLGEPSQVRLILRAQLVNVSQRQVMGTQVFETLEPTPTPDAYGGVQAANRALSRLLTELATFVAALPQASR